MRSIGPLICLAMACINIPFFPDIWNIAAFVFCFGCFVFTMFLALS